MNKSINLLAKKNVHNGYQEKFLQGCNWVAVIFLLLTAGSSLLLFIITLNPSLSSIKQQENNMLTNLSFKQGKIAKYLFIQNRLPAITKIIKTRHHIDSTIAAFQHELPEDVNINTIHIVNKTVSMTVYSNSLVSLNTFFTNMTALVHNKTILKKMVLETISANQGVSFYTLSFKGDLL